MNPDEIHIRKIIPDDAAPFLDLMNAIDGETTFMMHEAGEREDTPEKERLYIEGMVRNPRKMIFVAETQGRLVGYVACLAGGLRRNGQTATVVIGILQSHAGKGLGTRLFETMEAWAREVGVHRLELHVDTENKAGIALYLKRDFMIEGVAKEIKLVAGRFVDQIMMAKILS